MLGGGGVCGECVCVFVGGMFVGVFVLVSMYVCVCRGWGFVWVGRWGGGGVGEGVVRVKGGYGCGCLWRGECGGGGVCVGGWVGVWVGGWEGMGMWGGGVEVGMGGGRGGGYIWHV